MAERVRLLAFDTSSSACSVALLDTTKDPEKQITSLCKVLPMQQGQLILPMIKALLEAASLQLNEVDAIAYGCGPGSFTGARIASSVAQGLGYAMKCPIVPISSLAAMAQSAYLDRKWEALLVALDARVGEVHWAQYIVNRQGNVELIGKEKTCKPEQVEVIEKNKNWYGVGDGWLKYKHIINKGLNLPPQAIYESQLPNAEAILPLAKQKFEKGQQISAFEAIPVYLR